VRISTNEQNQKEKGIERSKNETKQMTQDRNCILSCKKVVYMYYLILWLGLSRTLYDYSVWHNSSSLASHGCDIHDDEQPPRYFSVHRTQSACVACVRGAF